MSRDVPPQFEIQFLLGQPAGVSTEVEFVGGPRPGRQLAPDPGASVVTLPGGAYVRSVRCADDGAIRFIWRPATAIVEAAPGADA
ncbi:MAG TPA: hypothetical protein VNF73_02815 [Candidatus Saccharimonadales bacterium]|nr:hypothetical protein [Candidatus Saccharimonadales bacterium]